MVVADYKDVRDLYYGKEKGMKIKDATEKANEALEGVAAKVERSRLTKWILVALVIVLLVAVGLWFSKARATGYEYTPNMVLAPTGGAGGAGGPGGSSGPITVGGDSYSSRAWAVGAPSFANGALTCEAGIPLIGGTYEREGCAILRDAAAVHGTLPAGAERDAAIKEVLCNAPRIRAAYDVTGRPCKSTAPERRW